MTELCTSKTETIVEKLRKKEISSVELLNHCFDRIRQYDSVLRCYISMADRDSLIKEARESDNRRMQGRALGPLEGIPLAVKDNIHCTGLATTCGSRILSGYEPVFEATAVRQLKKAGALVLGKTNCDEFAMGSTCENSAIQTTRNPWDTGRVPGGSSGGSAAAVSAGLAAAALGSDTGGSIRQPASFCGIAGLKPTYGLVSRYGLVSYASSLDQIGPMARDVYGCALMLNAMSGHDAHDSTSLETPVMDYAAGIKDSPGKVRVAYFPELLAQGISQSAWDHFSTSIQALRETGAVVDEVSFPALQYAIASYYFIATAEATSNQSRYDGVKYGYRSSSQASYQEMLFSTRSSGFGREVKKRILLGNFVLSSGYYDAYYRKAQKVRTYIREELMKILEKYDFIVMPTTPDIAFPTGESESDPLKIYLADITTVIPNLTGNPALSVPSGFIDSMPMGLQIIGRPLEEASMLQIAYAFERQVDLPLTPPLPSHVSPGNRVEKSAPPDVMEKVSVQQDMYSTEAIQKLSRSYNDRIVPDYRRVTCSDLPHYIGSRVTLAGWIHRIRGLGGIEFYELRDRTGFTQLVMEGGRNLKRINLETVVQVSGIASREDRSPFGSIEIKVDQVTVLGLSDSDLPVSVNAPLSNINLPTILDNRVVSIRNPRILETFRVQSEVTRLFGDFLRSRGFTEIKSPKIISSGTEGGTNIFEVKYFDRTAFLAQSPQFYKQIMVGSGLERVFEIGPVFRAEHHDTIRHLNEYISLDFEMGFISDEQDIIDVQEEILRYIIANIIEKFRGILKERGSSIVMPEKIPRIHFLEALDILRGMGVTDREEGDISPEGEKALCRHMEEHGGSSFVYVIGYPVNKRPMYTMPDERLPGYTRSFDLLFKGIEITTGGQRIHDYHMLRENIIAFGQNPADFREYLDAFKYGMPPHGGLGMGLERVTMKLLDLKNIREACLFPRDINRLSP